MNSSTQNQMPLPPSAGFVAAVPGGGVNRDDPRWRFAWINYARSAPLRGVPKNVLRALADFADEDGKCWPGIKRLARECGWSERAVQRALRELEADGWITIKEGTKRGTDRQGSNVYKLTGRGAARAPEG